MVSPWFSHGFPMLQHIQARRGRVPLRPSASAAALSERLGFWRPRNGDRGSNGDRPGAAAPWAETERMGTRDTRVKQRI